MKNKQSFKYLLYAIVLMLGIILNISHYQKNKLNLSTNLNKIIKISTFQTENFEDHNTYKPILNSPSKPNDNMTEEGYLELIHRQRKLQIR